MIPLGGALFVLFDLGVVRFSLFSARNRGSISRFVDDSRVFFGVMRGVAGGLFLRASVDDPDNPLVDIFVDFIPEPLLVHDFLLVNQLLLLFYLLMQLLLAFEESLLVAGVVDVINILLVIRVVKVLGSVHVGRFFQVFQH